jgi:hypothetical protein
MRLAHVILVFALAALTAHVASAERALLDYEECDNWDYDWAVNARYVRGTSVGAYVAATAAKCGDMCIEEDGCYTFNFYKR